MNSRKPPRYAGRAALVAVATLLGALAALASSAHAQAPAPSDAPLTGKVSLDEFQKELTNFSTSFGGAMTAGNTESMQATVGTVFGMIRERHALDLTMDFAYGQARPSRSQPLVDTVRNLRSRGRYALFLSTMDALFVAGAYRWDTFAGLDARLQGQVGYMRNLMVQDKMRLWGELGYDLTYENFDPDPLPDPDDATRFIKGYKYLHSARLFLGYDNQINPMMVVLLGIEGLLNVQDPGDSRVNGDLALRSVVVDRLQLELKLSVQIDTEPAPRNPKLEIYDGIVKLNLIYTLI
jgi:putative salt-induced outer membrane protein YdiY